MLPLAWGTSGGGAAALAAAAAAAASRATAPSTLAATAAAAAARRLLLARGSSSAPARAHNTHAGTAEAEAPSSGTTQDPVITRVRAHLKVSFGR
jgi:hypothetical protein